MKHHSIQSRKCSKLRIDFIFRSTNSKLCQMSTLRRAMVSKASEPERHRGQRNLKILCSLLLIRTNSLMLCMKWRATLTYQDSLPKHQMLNWGRKLGTSLTMSQNSNGEKILINFQWSITLSLLREKTAFKVRRKAKLQRLWMALN